MASDKRVAEFKQKVADLCREYGMEICATGRDADLIIVALAGRRKPRQVLDAEDCTPLGVPYGKR